MKLTDREILPRSAGGVDWGARRRVLARSADGLRLLFIREAHTMPVGARGFGPQPVGSALILLAPGNALGDELKAGRVRKADIEYLAPRIDKVLGAGAAARIELSRTLVVP